MSYQVEQEERLPGFFNTVSFVNEAVYDKLQDLNKFFKWLKLKKISRKLVVDSKGSYYWDG